MPPDATVNAALRRRHLAARRKALGLTQEDLAELLEVERSTVARWERGQSDPLPWIRPKLARALRVSLDQLESLLATGGPDRPAGVPRQLPAAVAGFTGREAELQALTQVLDQARESAPGTVVISAVGGMAGVGKTALTLHWAHQSASRFPDGQLYVNLRGFDPSGVPAVPEQAIRGFLDALGVAPEQIPATPDAQAGLYRSLLARRQALIVLDNARDEQQVRPLLPASPATMVVITSRNQLAGLAAGHGARLLSLDILSHDEATQLLAARIGPARAAAEPDAVGQIASLCAYLPLALAVAAARAAARPHQSLAALAAELRDAPGRLDALESGDRAASLRAVFSWSVQQLSPDAARMFGLLGIHPGPDITAAAAASLAASPPHRAGQQLGELSRAHLVTEHAPGRFTMHDLLRTYATSQARAAEDHQPLDEATGRVLDHYLHTAHAAAQRYKPSDDAIVLAAPRPGVTPERLADHQQALAWFEAEHHVLLASISLAASTGFDVHAWQLPWAIGSYLDWRGHWAEWVTVQSTAVAAATRLADPAGLAMSLRILASAKVRIGDHDQAMAHLEQCLELYQRLGDRFGEAQVLKYLGVVAERQGRDADALDHSEQALRIFQAIGRRSDEAQMLNNVGWTHAQLGRYQEARQFCQRAVTLHAELGLRNQEAIAWDSLGYVEHHLGNLAEAAACYQRALRLAREYGDRFGQAEILTHLGDTSDAAGDQAHAQEAWQQALAILDDLHHAKAGQLRAKLAGNPDPSG